MPLYTVRMHQDEAQTTSPHRLHTRTRSPGDTHLITSAQTRTYKHDGARLHAARSAHRLNPAVCDFRAAAWLGLRPKSLHLSCVPCLGWTSNTLHLVTWHQRAHALLNTARCAGTHGPGQSDCFLLICRCSQETDVTYFLASDLIVC